MEAALVRTIESRQGWQDKGLGPMELKALIGIAIAGYLAQAQKQLTRPKVVPTRADVVCEAEWLAYNATYPDRVLPSTTFPVYHYTWTILSEQWATWPESCPEESMRYLLAAVGKVSE